MTNCEEGYLGCIPTLDGNENLVIFKIREKKCLEPVLFLLYWFVNGSIEVTTINGDILVHMALQYVFKVKKKRKASKYSVLPAQSSIHVLVCSGLNISGKFKDFD